MNVYLKIKNNQIVAITLLTEKRDQWWSESDKQNIAKVMVDRLNINEVIEEAIRCGFITDKNQAIAVSINHQETSEFEATKGVSICRYNVRLFPNGSWNVLVDNVRTVCEYLSQTGHITHWAV